MKQKYKVLNITDALRRANHRANATDITLLSMYDMFGETDTIKYIKMQGAISRDLHLNIQSLTKKYTLRDIDDYCYNNITRNDLLMREYATSAPDAIIPYIREDFVEYSAIPQLSAKHIALFSNPPNSELLIVAHIENAHPTVLEHIVAQLESKRAIFFTNTQMLSRKYSEILEVNADLIYYIYRYNIIVNI